MPDDTIAGDIPSDVFLRKTTLGAPRPGGGIRPLRPPREFHKIQDPRSIFALADFPTKALIYAYRKIFQINDFGKFRYEENQKRTGLYIRDQYPQLAQGSQTTEQKPAVITSRGDLTPAYADGRQNQRRVSPDTQLSKFTERWQVPYTIHCLSKDGVEAEQLACVILWYMKTDEDIFKANYGIHAILGLRMGVEGPSMVTSEIQMIEVPVTFTLEFSASWARKPDGDPLLKLASLDVRST